MNKVILYTTDCPKCRVLKAKLQHAAIEFEEEHDVDVMLMKGMKSAPALEVDGKIYDFKSAIDWIGRELNGNN